MKDYSWRINFFKVNKKTWYNIIYLSEKQNKYVLVYYSNYFVT